MECSEYNNIHKEFISNFDGILQNDFHLKSFDKTKYIPVFDQSIWECSGHFCVVYGIYAKRNFIL